MEKLKFAASQVPIPKTIVYIDRRLGCFRITGVLGVIAYAVVTLIFNQHYLLLSTPRGDHTIYVSKYYNGVHGVSDYDQYRRELFGHIQEGTDDKINAACLSTEYSYFYNYEWSYGPFECPWDILKNYMTMKGVSNLFVKTSVVKEDVVVLPYPFIKEYRESKEEVQSNVTSGKDGQGQKGSPPAQASTKTFTRSLKQKNGPPAGGPNSGGDDGKEVTFEDENDNLEDQQQPNPSDKQPNKLPDSEEQEPEPNPQDQTPADPDAQHQGPDHDDDDNHADDDDDAPEEQQPGGQDQRPDAGPDAPDQEPTDSEELRPNAPDQQPSQNEQPGGGNGQQRPDVEEQDEQQPDQEDEQQPGGQDEQQTGGQNQQEEQQPAPDQRPGGQDQRPDDAAPGSPPQSPPQEEQANGEDERPPPRGGSGGEKRPPPGHEEEGEGEHGEAEYTEPTLAKEEAKLPVGDCLATDFNDWLTGGCPEKYILGYDNMTDSCVCMGTRATLYMGAENLTMTLMHSALTAASETRLSNPMTYVRREGSSEIAEIFQPGMSITLPLWRLLQIAGVDLDQKHTDISMASVDPDGYSKYPYVRITGITLELTFKYVNYKWAVESRARKSPVAILEVNPVYRWTSMGHRIRAEEIRKVALDDVQFTDDYSYGINIVVSSTGTIGTFDLASLVGSLTQILVLMGVVTSVITIVAHYFSGTMSATYKAAAKEKFVYGSTFANFALNAINITRAFDAIDSNRSGYISFDELRQHLSESLGKYATEDQIRLLTTFVYEQVRNVKRVEALDTDPVTPVKVKSGWVTAEDHEEASISRQQFLEICNPGAFDVEDLLHVLRMLDPTTDVNMMDKLFLGQLRRETAEDLHHRQQKRYERETSLRQRSHTTKPSSPAPVQEQTEISISDSSEQHRSLQLRPLWHERQSMLP